MKYLKSAYFILSLTVLSFFSCSPSNNIEVSKSSGNNTGENTLIYSLPKTAIDIDIEVTKVTTKSGPYAAYAEKYLTLTGVPLTDSESYEISSVKIVPVNEPDPDQYYALNFKSYPSSLENLFTMTQQGLMLNLEKSWSAVSKDFSSAQSQQLFSRSIYDPVVIENVDTLYKTILTDASFVKVPIYKKSVTIKNEEDKAKDMANLILKLRKRKLKLMLGEYEYHPDGEALKVLAKELTKQEEDLMSNFIGIKLREVKHYAYSFTPTNPVTKEILWFAKDNGVSQTPKAGAIAVSVAINMKETGALGNEKQNERLTNSIYFRSPVPAQVVVKLGNDILSDSKVLVYQAGKIQQLPVKP